MTLAETLDLKAASPLADALKSAQGGDLALDASQVKRVGAQCLQVLLAAKADWAAAGLALTFDNPSDEFRDGLALMGATSLIQD